MGPRRMSARKSGQRRRWALGVGERYWGAPSELGLADGCGVLGVAGVFGAPEIVREGIDKRGEAGGGVRVTGGEGFEERGLILLEFGLQIPTGGELIPVAAQGD